MSRRVVTVAGAAVLLSSADTYVVVLALPVMMADLGIGLDRLQQATPIISGFLLGYVAVMLLIGRLSDVAGRLPVLYGCLAVFAAGSLVTASAHELGTAVAGRALQGAGGGGLVPVTLALVADLWPTARRGTALGAVGAAQEAGSVAGPLYGALILSLSTWRTIFWINLPLCVLLAVALWAAHRTPGTARVRVDIPGLALAAVALVAVGLAVAAPDPLVSDATFGALYTPLAGAGWLTPLTVIALVAALAFGAWELRGPRLSRAAVAFAAATRRVDWGGATLVALSLAGIVVSFAAADPSREAIAPAAVVALPLAAAAAAAFVARERRASQPLVELGTLRSPGAYGALLTNLAVGAALMAALLDIPILARATVFPDSQLGAALVLLRLLAAVPIGAVAGGWLCQRFGVRPVAAAGMALAAAALAVMSRFGATTLGDPLGASWLHPSDPVLVAAGLGFGLAIAPVNASILAAVRPGMHGVAAALAVVARVVGMLVGVSVLTAVGLQQFFAATSKFPSPGALCPRTPLTCPAYNALLQQAVLDELHVVFIGAAACAAIAALFGAMFLGRSPAALAAYA
ncbi:MAG: MFS transporter [Candidatus Dormibacteria bacterium]